MEGTLKHLSVAVSCPAYRHGREPLHVSFLTVDTEGNPKPLCVFVLTVGMVGGIYTSLS